MESHVVQIIGVWSGIDNGPLLGSKFEQYLKPLEHAADLPPNKQVDSPVPLHHALDIALVSFTHGNFWFNVHTFASTVFPEADYYALVANQIDDWISIPSVYVFIDFQPYGGNGKGTQMNRNVGLNGYPQRDIMMITDNWIFHRDESVGEEVVASVEDFVEQAKETSFYQPTHIWQSTEALSALEASLVEDGPELYYPSREQYWNLMELKARVDPEDIFHSKMSIPVGSGGDS